jgi:hypothetical protein
MGSILKMAVVSLVIIGFVIWHYDSIEPFVNRLKGVEISELKADPEAYDGSIVILRGQAGESYNIPTITRDLYKFEDEGGDVWVLARGGAPLNGTHMDLKGLVLVEQENFGAVRINGIMVVEIKVYK